MNHSLAAPLWIVQIGTVLTARASADSLGCDPALDLSQKTIPRPGKDPISLSQLLSDYERERSPALRDLLPVKPGQQVRQWFVRPLVPGALRYAMEATGLQRASRAFLSCCHSYRDSAGHEFKAENYGGLKDHSRGWLEASDDWLDHVQLGDGGDDGAYGSNIIREVSKVALDRAEAGPRVLRPFALPPGLTLPL